MNSLDLLVVENGEKVDIIIIEATVANKTKRTDQIYFNFNLVFMTNNLFQ